MNREERINQGTRECCATGDLVLDYEILSPEEFLERYGGRRDCE